MNQRIGDQFAQRLFGEHGDLASDGLLDHRVHRSRVAHLSDESFETHGVAALVLAHRHRVFGRAHQIAAVQTVGRFPWSRRNAEHDYPAGGMLQFEYVNALCNP